MKTLRLCRYLLATTLLAGAIGLLASPAANAGTYEVRACVYGGPLFFDGRYEQHKHGRVDVVQNCDRQARGWTGVYQARNGSALSAGEGAGYRWHAPVGASFVASRVYAKLKNANGVAAQFYATNPHDGYYSLDANQPHDGVERQMYVDFSSTPRAQVAVRLACLTRPPCSNRATDVKAFFELREMTLRLRDSRAPNVWVGGDLFSRPAGQAIYRGSAGFSFGASDDGGGLWRAHAEVNGSVLGLAPYSCPGVHAGFADRTRPCPVRAGRQEVVDLSRPPFREGPNRIRICVHDYATGGGSNTGCSGWHDFAVDNIAPQPPRSFTVAGGEGWRAENRFDLSWSNPSGGATAITAARYWIVDAATGAMVQGPTEVPAGGISRLRNIRVPGRGQYTIWLQLRDAAGNLGTATAVSLRFDDLRPGDIGSAAPPKWLAAADFPFRLELRPPAMTGPSGLAGYAFTVSDDEQHTPCAAGFCLAEEIGLTGAAGDRVVEIERLPPGIHWLSAVAVSGARLRSVNAHRVRLRVDLTDPKTRLGGVPGGWTRGPVTVTARANDGESGMAVPVDPRVRSPQTVIEVAGQTSRREIGDRATATIARQGVHRVRHWARDLAGNANDGGRDANGHLHAVPGESTLKIDWTAPQLEFLPTDPEAPERIRVKMNDSLSGPADGGIRFRPAGSPQPPIPLESRLTGDTLEAHFPSDELADGLYEVSAYSVDRAGNSSTAAEEAPPTTMLSVPLKPATSIAVHFVGRSRATRRLVKHGSSEVVKGRLRDRAGTPLSGLRVELVERFRPGSKVGHRVTAHGTDSEGRFRHRLKPGPSRRIVARFPGGHLLARSESRALRLASRAAVALHLGPLVARNGEAVKMRGRVRGREAVFPRKGKLVAIQYLDAGRKRWRPVELVRTDRKGRFRYTYRFRTVASPQRFRFRAVAVPEAGWPFLAARTPGRAVVVYPR